MAGKRKGGKAEGGGSVIVIRREEGGEHGHHGGAWKVAYADFVTAMMAFFLLMWLLNATTEEQRRGIADYFSPANMMGRSTSGSGLPFGGQTPNDDQSQVSNSGAMRIEQGPRPVVVDIEEDDSETPAQPVPWREAPPGQDEEAMQAVPGIVGAPPSRPGPRAGPAPPRGGPASQAAEEERPEAMGEEALRRELARREREAFERAAEQIRQVVRDDPALAELARQLIVEHTPEGLRIQIVDAERQPMFALGSAAPNDRARALIGRVAQIVALLPNAIAVAGHTDATPFRGQGSNWDLSSDRANATRRLLADGGIAEGRIRSVTGNAERDPLLPDQPNAAANRRVSITLIRQQPEPAAR